MREDPIREMARQVARERERVRLFKGIGGRGGLVELQKVGEYWHRRHNNPRDPFSFPEYRDPQARRRAREARKREAS